MGGNNPGNKVFTGTVTKLHDNFGFVDDDVFFQTNVVKGQVPPKVGDRVMVEASFNANMPFKWNATRITPIPNVGNQSSMGGTGLLGAGGNQQQMMGMGGGGMGGGQQMGGGQRMFGGDMRQNRGGPGMDSRGDQRGSQRGMPPRDSRPMRRDDMKDRSSKKRSRSRSKSRSPARRRARHLPRYNVSVPKVSLTFPASNVVELKKRYSSLYIPSDFFSAKHVWNEAFPLAKPFNIQFPSAFHVFNKEHVEPISVNKFKYDPPDADYTFVAKVMLLASPGLEDLYDRTCQLAEKEAEDKDPREGLVHPSRAVKFLVGLKGKSETMAIGGPWSPSLDGADPRNDPLVLINTAIRTCSAMTGIDLSACTQWTRFNEIHYRRQATSTKPARTETVVIFFPDVWSAMPNKMAYDAAAEVYAKNCQLKLEGKPVKAAEAEETVEDEEDDGEAVKKGDPTPWKELDPKTMKVRKIILKP